jgi:meso-butanediol dehydrogenase / (S,S)-butanediol dehydrogenase / diacetyl reductase
VDDTMTNLVEGPGPLLSGRVAVVTGGAGGIGEATCRLFVEDGARVATVDVDAERTKAVVTELGDATLGVVADVRTDVERIRDEVLGHFGRVDILVNNAGHWVRQVDGFVDEDPELAEQLHQINFLHVVRMTQAFLPGMLERKRGSIVNVSSVEGLRGYPPGVIYGAYKAAVVQLTRSLGVQLGTAGVRVNGIGPDVTDSIQVPYDKMVRPEHEHLWPQWVPIGRMGVPRDQARIILFLASDLSAFITGHTIPSDGGTSAAGGWFRSAQTTGGRVWTNRPIAP